MRNYVSHLAFVKVAAELDQRFIGNGAFAKKYIYIAFIGLTFTII